MIFVITHKKFDDSILNSDIYKILHVGQNTNCKDEYLRDDGGVNISLKNAYFCELTGLYWIWKNNLMDDDELTGVVHYRRYFTTKEEYRAYSKLGKMPSVLDDTKILSQCNDHTVILPEKYRTLSTLRKSYRRCHDITDLELVREAIVKLCPEYEKAYLDTLSQHYGYYYNMIICRSKLLRQYCEWLFPILFCVENQMIHNKGDFYQDRVYGFLAERLLQVWIRYQELDVLEMPVFNTEEKPVTWIGRNSERIRYIINKYVRRNRNG